MNYVVQYRGGPNAGKKEALQSLPNEMPAVRYIKSPKITGAFWDKDGPVAIQQDITYGVYSRVFTPQKNGTYLYVWIKK